MIKDFKTYIKEGRMGRLVNAGVDSVRKQDRLTEEEVRSYIFNDWGNYNKYCEKVIIHYEDNKPIVDIVGNFIFRKNITEIPFQFGKVTGSFNCSDCGYLTSLEGCPQEVGGYFICSYCSNLTSLEGCPKKVGGDFNCWSCGKIFTEEEVRSLCDVKGKVVV